MAKPSIPVDIIGNTRQLRKQIEELSKTPVIVNVKGNNGVGGGKGGGIDNLTPTLTTASAAATSLSQPLGKISGDISEIDKALGAANARVIAFGAAAGGIFALERAVSQLFTSFVDTEKQLTNINAVLNLDSSGIKSFGKQIFKTAGQTGQSFDVASEAALEFSRQGLGVEDTLSRTKDALVLSRLSGLDAASSVEAVTAAVNSYRKEGLSTSEVVNKLANVDAGFAVSSADLAEALSRVGSSASDAGVSFDELIALVTSAQQTTARGGSVIGNSLKSIFTRLNRSKTRDMLEGFGISMLDDSGREKNQITLLKDLANVYGNLGTEQKNYVAEQVGGVFQINILKAALSDLGRGYSIYDKALSTSLSTTNQAEVRNESLNKTLASLGNQTLNNVKSAASTVGEGLFAPAAKNVLKIGDFLANSVNDADSSSVGAQMGKGIITGLGSFLSGPGLAIIGAVLGKLFVDFSKYGAQAAQSLLGLDSAAKNQVAVQQSVGAFLQKNVSLYSAIAGRQISATEAAKQYLQVITQQTAALQAQSSIVKSVSQAVVTQIGNKGSKGGSVIKTGGKATHYVGFVPNFAPISERDYYQNIENAGAANHKGGYRAGLLKSVTVHDGLGGKERGWMTSRESKKTWTNSSGHKATMITPPNGFSNQTISAATGFVPQMGYNFRDLEHLPNERGAPRIQGALRRLRSTFGENYEGDDYIQVSVNWSKRKMLDDMSGKDYEKKFLRSGYVLTDDISGKDKSVIDAVKRITTPKFEDKRYAEIFNNTSAVDSMPKAIVDSVEAKAKDIVNLPKNERKAAIRKANIDYFTRTRHSIPKSSIESKNSSSVNALVEGKMDNLNTLQLDLVERAKDNLFKKALSINLPRMKLEEGVPSRRDVLISPPLTVDYNPLKNFHSSGFIPNFAQEASLSEIALEKSALKGKDATRALAATSRLRKRPLSNKDWDRLYAGSFASSKTKIGGSTTDKTGKKLIHDYGSIARYPHGVSLIYPSNAGPKETPVEAAYPEKTNNIFRGRVLSSGFNSRVIKGKIPNAKKKMEEAIVQTANEMSVSFGLGGGLNVGNIPNSGAVVGAAGTAFEMSLTNAARDSVRAGGQSAGVDFSHPTPQLRNLFNNIPGAYDAKSSSSPSLAKDVFMKFLRGDAMANKNDKAFNDLIKREAHESVKSSGKFDKFYTSKGMERTVMYDASAEELSSFSKAKKDAFANALKFRTIPKFSGFIPNFASTIGYLDGDVLKDPKYANIVGPAMQVAGVTSVSDYHKYLGHEVSKARASGKLKRFSLIYGVPGSGKSTMMMGGKPQEGGSKINPRVPILTLEDIAKVNEIIDTRASIPGTIDNLQKGGYLNNVDRALILSSSEPESQKEIKKRRKIRDAQIKAGTATTNFGRGVGTSLGSPIHSGVIEAAATHYLGKDRTKIVDILPNFKLKHRDKNAYPQIEHKKIGLTFGAFAPSTKGHLSNMIAAQEMGIKPEDFVTLISRQGGRVDKKDPHSWRTALFGQSLRAEIAKRTFIGANIARQSSPSTSGTLPKILEIGGNRFVIPKAGSVAFIGDDKTESSIKRYESAGYKVAVGSRSEGVSGTDLRKAIFSGNVKEIRRLMTPEAAKYVESILPQLQARNEVFPKILDRVYNKLAGEIALVDKDLAPYPPRMSPKWKKENPNEVEKVLELREKKKKLQAKEQSLPNRYIRKLGMFPNKYGRFSSGFVPNFASPALINAIKSRISNPNVSTKLSEGVGLADNAYIRAASKLGVNTAGLEAFLKQPGFPLRGAKKIQALSRALGTGFGRSFKIDAIKLGDWSYVKSKFEQNGLSKEDFDKLVGFAKSPRGASALKWGFKPKFNDSNLFSGFVPNFASLKSSFEGKRAISTERSYGLGAVFDEYRGMPYVRQPGQSSNFRSMIRKDHPEGLRAAISNSAKSQGLSKGFIPNFAPSDEQTGEGNSSAMIAAGLQSVLFPLMFALPQKGAIQEEAMSLRKKELQDKLEEIRNRKRATHLEEKAREQSNYELKKSALDQKKTNISIKSYNRQQAVLKRDFNNAMSSIDKKNDRLDAAYARRSQSIREGVDQGRIKPRFANKMTAARSAFSGPGSKLGIAMVAPIIADTIASGVGEESVAGKTMSALGQAVGFAATGAAIGGLPGLIVGGVVGAALMASEYSKASREQPVLEAQKKYEQSQSKAAKEDEFQNRVMSEMENYYQAQEQYGPDSKEATSAKTRLSARFLEKGPAKALSYEKAFSEEGRSGVEKIFGQDADDSQRKVNEDQLSLVLAKVEKEKNQDYRSFIEKFKQPGLGQDADNKMVKDLMSSLNTLAFGSNGGRGMQEMAEQLGGTKESEKMISELGEDIKKVKTWASEIDIPVLHDGSATFIADRYNYAPDKKEVVQGVHDKVSKMRFAFLKQVKKQNPDLSRENLDAVTSLLHAPEVLAKIMGPILGKEGGNVTYEKGIKAIDAKNLYGREISMVDAYRRRNEQGNLGSVNDIIQRYNESRLENLAKTKRVDPNIESLAEKRERKLQEEQEKDMMRLSTYAEYGIKPPKELEERVAQRAINARMSQIRDLDMEGTPGLANAVSDKVRMDLGISSQRSSKDIAANMVDHRPVKDEGFVTPEGFKQIDKRFKEMGGENMSLDDLRANKKIQERDLSMYDILDNRMRSDAGLTLSDAAYQFLQENSKEREMMGDPKSFTKQQEAEYKRLESIGRGASYLLEEAPSNSRGYSHLSYLREKTRYQRNLFDNAIHKLEEKSSPDPLTPQSPSTSPPKVVPKPIPTAVPAPTPTPAQQSPTSTAKQGNDVKNIVVDATPTVNTAFNISVNGLDNVDGTLTQISDALNSQFGTIRQKMAMLETKIQTLTARGGGVPA